MLLAFAMACVLLAGTFLLLVRGVKAARAKKLSLIARIAFGICVLLALLVGIRLCVQGVFQMNERLRIQGLPIPLVIFVREGENWTDFVKPKFIGYTCMVADALFPVGLLGLLFVCAIRRRSAPTD